MRDNEIREAVGRGWCHPNTEDRVMDTDLALAISEEVEQLFEKEGAKVYLGFATTAQLIEELASRLGIDTSYRTVDKSEKLVQV